MTTKFSRTVNPLHFEDLEPHRFEDLVRQLAYDFRDWHSIEATGRSGSDEGVDIRAVERIRSAAALHTDETGDEDEISAYEKRLWIIQCKREKALGPKKVKDILAAAIEDSGINDEASVPHGFIIAAACDVSSKTRETFRIEANGLGLSEFFIWAKSELEDMLFLPKNDHLLFAYFGLSLHARRRSEKTAFSARLAMKRKFVTIFGSLHGPFHKPVLVRDATAHDYPRHNSTTDIRWRYFQFAGHVRPDHIALIAEEYWAWAKFERKEWDMIPTFDQSWPLHPKLIGVDEPKHRSSAEEEKARRYWLTKVPKGEQAYYRVYGFIHYDRILLIDDLGDSYHEPPHIILDCTASAGFFDDVRAVIERDDHWAHEYFFADDTKRVQLFPQVIPEVSDEEFDAALRGSH